MTTLLKNGKEYNFVILCSPLKYNKMRAEGWKCDWAGNGLICMIKEK